MAPEERFVLGVRSGEMPRMSPVGAGREYNRTGNWQEMRQRNDLARWLRWREL